MRRWVTAIQKEVLKFTRDYSDVTKSDAAAQKTRAEPDRIEAALNLYLARAENQNSIRSNSFDYMLCWLELKDTAVNSVYSVTRQFLTELNFTALEGCRVPQDLESLHEAKAKEGDDASPRQCSIIGIGSRLFAQPYRSSAIKLRWS